MMEITKKKTEIARNIYVRHFYIQEWFDLKQVILEHIITHLNLSDTSTNALGWVLHNKHTGIIMGEYESTFMHRE